LLRILYKLSVRMPIMQSKNYILPCPINL